MIALLWSTCTGIAEDSWPECSRGVHSGADVASCNPRLSLRSSTQLTKSCHFLLRGSWTNAFMSLASTSTLAAWTASYPRGRGTAGGRQLHQDIGCTDAGEGRRCWSHLHAERGGRGRKTSEKALLLTTPLFRHHHREKILSLSSP